MISIPVIDKEEAPASMPGWTEIQISCNKFMVVDRKIITTGSFNWSLHADTKNDENLLIIYSEELAEKYKEEFWEIWGQSG